MRRDCKVKWFTVGFLETLWNDGPDAYPAVRSPTISDAYSWAICCTSGTLLGVNGLGRTTMRTPGIPKDVALAWAARVKELVITLTDGTPLVSVITVSWRPHAVQDPQSAIP